MGDLVKRLRDVEGYAVTVSAVDALRNEAADALEQAQDYHEKECLALIDDRDKAEESATHLAGLIGEYFGIQIGEHSNLNCPIRNALNELNDQLAMSVAMRESAGDHGSKPKMCNFQGCKHTMDCAVHRNEHCDCGQSE